MNLPDNQSKSDTPEALIARLIYPETPSEDFLSTVSSPGIMESLSIEMLQSEGVYPLFCHRLKQTYHSPETTKNNDLAKTNPLFSKSIKAGYQSIAQELDMDFGLEKTLHSINDFSPLLLKGVVMSHCFYEHPHLRPMDDIDLVIPDKSAGAVQTRLIKKGFKLLNNSFDDIVMNQFIMTNKLSGGSTIALDIHTRVFNRPGMRDLLNYDEILSNARKIQIAGQTALVPCAAHCLIHAALHLMAHHQNSRKLIWLYDIYLLEKSLGDEEIERLLAYSSKKRIAFILVCALERCHRFFPLTGLKLLPKLKEQVKQQINIEHPSTIALTDASLVDRLKSDWKAASGVKVRLKWLKAHLFPSYSYIRKKYNVSAFPLVWACYVWRIVHGTVKLFRTRS